MLQKRGLLELAREHYHLVAQWALLLRVRPPSEGHLQPHWFAVEVARRRHCAGDLDGLRVRCPRLVSLGLSLKTAGDRIGQDQNCVDQLAWLFLHPGHGVAPEAPQDGKKTAMAEAARSACLSKAAAAGY